MSPLILTQSPETKLLHGLESSIDKPAFSTRSARIILEVPVGAWPKFQPDMCLQSKQKNSYGADFSYFRPSYKRRVSTGL